MINLLKKCNNEKYDYDFKKKICILVLIFFIGSVCGYIYEEIFYLLDDHVLVNRGFLYGPYLPVYGVGAVFLVLCLKKFKSNPFVIFFGALILTGIVEYIAGYGLYAIFHRTWWDYTGLFLNIDGYVCLRSVITFAIGGLLLIYIVDPLVSYYVKNIEFKKLKIYSFIIVFVILFDLILTLLFRNVL